MRRLESIYRWARCAIGAGAVLALILAVAFWDTVIAGRSIDEQLEDNR